ncbi:peptide deformylase [Patescibacteria group bacterium]|nr:peptide deformylase [Patescibacteria group bacterium]
MAGKRLTLVKSDDPVLRAVAAPVKKPSEVTDLAENLLATMKTEGGVGLAAPQVGKSIRLFVTSAGGTPEAYINPKISETSPKQIPWEEGCLSLPRLLGEVRRPKKVTMQAQTPDGNVVTVKADELLARVIQHEIDHLDGILFPDRMDDLRNVRTISEEEWQTRFVADGDVHNAEM